ncbi:MAG: hypothetical protein C0475_05180 [Planctomyces sp.]|nr:hypothetical protein [Planctomyces sp.]MBA4038823.1 hypothetical protein [Planctomyces sp.]
MRTDPSNAPASRPAGPAAGDGFSHLRCRSQRLVRGYGLAAVRVAVGGLMVLGGYLKLGLPDVSVALGMGPLGVMRPDEFMAAIKKFHVPGLNGWAWGLEFAAVAVPWAEVVAGAMLALGLWPRAAALAVAGMMGVFAAGILSVLVRGIEDVSCTCFGSLKLICQGPLGACHVARNAAIAGLALLTVVLGPGRGALGRRG